MFSFTFLRHFSALFLLHLPAVRFFPRRENPLKVFGVTSFGGTTSHCKIFPPKINPSIASWTLFAVKLNICHVSSAPAFAALQPQTRNVFALLQELVELALEETPEQSPERDDAFLRLPFQPPLFLLLLLRFRLRLQFILHLKHNFEAETVQSALRPLFGSFWPQFAPNSFPERMRCKLSGYGDMSQSAYKYHIHHRNLWWFWALNFTKKCARCSWVCHTKLIRSVLETLTLERQDVCPTC